MWYFSQSKAVNYIYARCKIEHFLPYDVNENVHSEAVVSGLAASKKEKEVFVTSGITNGVGTCSV